MDQDTSLTTEDLLDAWNLSEYKSVFTEHKITLDTLSALNEELIKELILPIGDHFIKKLADWKELADTLQEKHSPSKGTSIVQDSDDSVTVMKIRHSTTQEFQNVFQSNISPVKVRVSFVERWPIMNPNELVLVLVPYLLFVLSAGPVLMRQRTPLRLRGFLITYNSFKVLNSIYLASKFFNYIMDKGLFPRQCEYDDYAVYEIGALYWKFMVTKMLDLIDTVCFVLRKKYSQITFLHVYHHTFMVLITWSCLKYDPSDHWAFMATANLTIHAFMYTYYLISCFGPSFKKYLWWKKYLTMMQLAQFFAVIFHVIIQTYTTECPMGEGSYWVALANLTLFIILFVDFYKKRYRARLDNKSVAHLQFACTSAYGDENECHSDRCQ